MVVRQLRVRDEDVVPDACEIEKVVRDAESTCLHAGLGIVVRCIGVRTSVRIAAGRRMRQSRASSSGVSGAEELLSVRDGGRASTALLLARLPHMDAPCRHDAPLGEHFAFEVKTLREPQLREAERRRLADLALDERVCGVEHEPVRVAALGQELLLLRCREEPDLAAVDLRIRVVWHVARDDGRQKP